MFFLKKRFHLCLLSALVLGLLSANITFAADKKDKSAKRNAQMIQQLRQQQAELASAKEAQDAELANKEKALQDASREAAAAEGSLKRVKAEFGKSSSDLKKTKEALAETETQLTQTKTELEALQEQYKQALADLSFNEQQRKSQIESVALNNKLLNACTEKNQLLYAHSKSLIDIYETPSIYDSVMRKEPFFQLKRVELENILQNKLEEISDAKVSVTAGSY
jgi:chromosome segregation ATPase